MQRQSKPFAILDVETTGLDPAKHEIIEIAVKSPHGTFHSLVKPQRLGQAEPKALELNGYAANPDRWHNAPMIEEVLPKVMAHLEGCLMVGHNVSFDKGFLAAAHEQTFGKGLPFYHAFDTVTLAMEHLPDLGRFNLNVVCTVLGVTNEGAHTALADVLRCEKVLHKLLMAGPIDRWLWSRKAKVVVANNYKVV